MEWHQGSILIPLSECKNRVLYQIRSRNLDFGVFCQETNGFIGLREKCSYIYTFEEYHRDLGGHLGTVTPIRELPEILPSEILMNLSNKPLEWWLRNMEKKYRGLV